MSILKEVSKNTGVIQNNCKFILQNIKKRLFLDIIPIILTFEVSFRLFEDFFKNPQKYEPL